MPQDADLQSSFGDKIRVIGEDTTHGICNYSYYSSGERNHGYL